MEKQGCRGRACNAVARGGTGKWRRGVQYCSESGYSAVEESATVLYRIGTVLYRQCLQCCRKNAQESAKKTCFVLCNIVYLI